MYTYTCIRHIRPIGVLELRSTTHASRFVKDIALMLLLKSVRFLCSCHAYCFYRCVTSSQTVFAFGIQLLIVKILGKSDRDADFTLYSCITK